MQVTARVRADETDPKNRDAFADASTGGRLQSYVVDSRVVARADGSTFVYTPRTYPDEN